MRYVGVVVFLIVAQGCGLKFYREGQGSSASNQTLQNLARVQFNYTPQVFNVNTNVILSDPVTSGNLLVVAIASQEAGTLSINDTLGSSFTALPQQSNSSCATLDSRAQIFYTFLTSSGSEKVTLTSSFGGASNFAIAAAEYSGVIAYDTSAGTIASSNSVTLGAGSIQTSGATDLVFGLFVDEADTSGFNLTSGFTQQAYDASYELIIEDNIAVSPGTYTPSVTMTTPDHCWAATIAAFEGQ